MRIYLLIISLLSCSVVFGQLSTREKPMSFSRTDIPALETNNMEARSFAQLDMERIMQEDIENEKLGMPPRFGYKHRVNYNLENSGEWLVLPDGGRLWRLAVSSPGALSINLLYDKFWIPDGAKFWIYSYNQRQSIGAFTSENNRGTREAPDKFATGLVFSDQIVLEYYLPKGASEIGSISIVYVVHGYRHIPFSENRFWEQPLPCHININCSFGLDWQAEKNAVALILRRNDWCTGFLINNTAGDGRPFFMTAYHCLREEGGYVDIYDTNFGHWSFIWHYEMPCYEYVFPSFLPTLSGATLIAGNPISDFALLLLNEDPRSPNSGIIPYYLGWCRNTVNPGIGGGVAIHHPGGYVKKISRAEQVQSYPNSLHLGGPLVTRSHALWQVDFVEGTTEGGSSGSPFLNHNRRVIGQLVGGPGQCPDPANPTSIKFYGKFGVAWTGSVYPEPPATDPRRRLNYWLDPLDTDVMELSSFSSCVSNFVNRTVYTNLTVTGCFYMHARNIIVARGATLTLIADDNIYISNITIAENSRLILSAGSEVVFDGYLDVHLGAEFEMR